MARSNRNIESVFQKIDQSGHCRDLCVVYNEPSTRPDVRVGVRGCRYIAARLVPTDYFMDTTLYFSSFRLDGQGSLLGLFLDGHLPFASTGRFTEIHNATHYESVF
jgi:hypothetical protein